jgi:hypothetical protein
METRVDAKTVYPTVWTISFVLLPEVYSHLSSSHPVLTASSLAICFFKPINIPTRLLFAVILLFRGFRKGENSTMGLAYIERRLENISTRWVQSSTSTRFLE